MFYVGICPMVVKGWEDGRESAFPKTEEAPKSTVLPPQAPRPQRAAATPAQQGEKRLFIAEAPEPVSKFKKMHFRRLDMHFSVAFPRFTASKSSSKRLELQADPLGTAHFSF